MNQSNYQSRRFLAAQEFARISLLRYYSAIIPRRYNEVRAKKSKNAAIKKTRPVSEILGKKKKTTSRTRYLLTVVGEGLQSGEPLLALTALLVLLFP